MMKREKLLFAHRHAEVGVGWGGLNFEQIWKGHDYRKETFLILRISFSCGRVEEYTCLVGQMWKELNHVKIMCINRVR